MNAKIEKKIQQLGYLHAAWLKVFENNAGELDAAEKAIDKAIISISQELVELYQEDKNGNGGAES